MYSEDVFERRTPDLEVPRLHNFQCVTFDKVSCQGLHKVVPVIEIVRRHCQPFVSTMVVKRFRVRKRRL